MTELVPAYIFERLPERYRRRAREIAARVADIDNLLRRCDGELLNHAGKRLAGQLRHQPEIQPKDFAAEFRAACSDLPEWAISEATNDFLAGRVENHTGQFMPTCAEFARHARSIILPFIGEKYGLRNEAERLLQRAEDEARRHAIEIERMNPEVRKRVKAMVEAVTTGSAKATTAITHVIDDDTRKRLDEMKKPRPELPSKLTETRIVKGSRS
jgi:hypothetical protein